MSNKKKIEYVEPKSYFSPEMRRAALEYDRDHNVDTNEKLTPEMQLRLIDWLGISRWKDRRRRNTQRSSSS